MSTQNAYVRCLEQLAATPPKRAVAVIRSLLPGIEGGVALGAESQSNLGGAPNRRSAGELPHVLHGHMAGEKKANRA
jgi:hypothetical protein